MNQSVMRLIGEEEELMMIDTVVVDPKLVLSDVSHRPFGININYLRDHDDNRPGVRPLREAIRETGSRHLRYPGGEKSDWHLFDPQDPQQIGPYIQFAEGNRKMTFDDFIQLCRDTGTQPHVVVACDSLARTGVTEDQFLDNAIKWVTYATSPSAMQSSIGKSATRTGTTRLRRLRKWQGSSGAFQQP